MTIHPASARSLPLRERKKLRTRRALADAALRMFTEKGFDATTLEELVEEAEVSKSTFFRAFPAKEAVAIEAEAELWSAYLTALAGRELSGPILGELHQALAAAAAGLDPGWDERFLATRRLAPGEGGWPRPYVLGWTGADPPSRLNVPGMLSARYTVAQWVMAILPRAFPASRWRMASGPWPGE